ncbi:flippase-like domain-containing protein [Natronococcus sp. JC468]|uniref:lysylphosphatidylglycerol synthase transmembrane domain-containing protein n=1 Tax=Natronococcus sp. JC468 TaxID=1961921 RepID=UPI00143C60E6|nr:lysylphosphatidylglycerol synthase transmembrane domain-containing protein [Natronococcus sp. JC468]NKE35433.1 flippase-like domain-containing protein [Natronococcus sp. JC468]
MNGGERSHPAGVDESGEAGADSDGLAAGLTRRRLTIGGTVVVALGLLVVARELDVRTVAAEMAGADPGLLALAVGAYAVSWPLRGRRYGDILGAMGHRHGTAFLTMAVFVSQTANLAIPARAGDAARAYVLATRRGVPYPAGFASLVVERAFDLVAIAVLAAVAAAWLALGGAGPIELAAAAGGARTAILAAAAVSAATAGVGLVVVASARVDRDLGAGLRARVEGRPRLEGLLEAALRFGADVQVVAERPRALVAVGATSLLVWLLDALTAVAVLAALDSGLAVGSLLAVGTLAVSVGNLAKVLPLSQGGVGLYEAAFTALVVGLTPVGAGTALAAAIVDHALKNAVTLVGGAGSVAALGVSVSEAAGGEPDGTDGTGSFLGSPKK